MCKFKNIIHVTSYRRIICVSCVSAGHFSCFILLAGQYQTTPHISHFPAVSPNAARFTMDPGDPSAVPKPAAYSPPPPSSGTSGNNQLQEVRRTTVKFNQFVNYRATVRFNACFLLQSIWEDPPTCASYYFTCRVRQGNFHADCTTGDWSHCGVICY